MNPFDPLNFPEDQGPVEKLMREAVQRKNRLAFATKRWKAAAVSFNKACKAKVAVELAAESAENHIEERLKSITRTGASVTSRPSAAAAYKGYKLLRNGEVKVTYTQYKGPDQEVAFPLEWVDMKTHHWLPKLEALHEKHNGSTHGHGNYSHPGNVYYSHPGDWPDATKPETDEQYLQREKALAWPDRLGAPHRPKPLSEKYVLGRLKLGRPTVADLEAQLAALHKRLEEAGLG
jgi:hypothetical protein